MVRTAIIRRVLVLLAASLASFGAFVLPSPPALAAPLIPPAQACGVEWGSAQISRGSYAVLLIVGQPLDEIELRLDDRNGHWLYTATDSHVILTAPVTSDAVNISVVGIKDTNGARATCDPVGAPPFTDGRAQSIRNAAAKATPLQPTSYAADMPVTCKTPFATQHFVAYPTFMDTGDPSLAGTLKVHVAIDDQSRVTDVEVLESSDIRLTQPTLELFRHSQFQVETFRCVGVPWSFDERFEWRSGGPIEVY
ncbi:MAG TPA: hypothetical protein VMD91_16320 [Candidatus Sulfotelmatobacter sp.]|nr:hypothetical protein [Candidatus Sulfotelmatobacter sp.]